MIQICNAITHFCAEYAPILLPFLCGVLALGGLWLIKHPEDFYTVEEIDPDQSVELDEMAR